MKQKELERIASIRMMQRKSDFEMLTDLNKEISPIRSFLVIMAFVGIALTIMVADLKYHTNQLEKQIEELTGGKNE